MSWLVQLIGEMKQDLGNIQAKIDRLSDDQARTQEKIDSLVKFSWYARGMATVAALVIAFMLWLFAERVEELRRYIILAPAANVESMIR